MATPSSSATSASPPMAYLQANAIMATTSSIGMDPLEREQRKKAVQKFLARAEVSMVTRGLRARLSYASYKATHNISHIPLRDLEAQTQGQATSFSRAIPPKRRAGGNNYYNNPATQGNGGTDGNAAISGTHRGTMAPPSVSMTTSRSHYPGVNGNAHRSANATQSLYTSILAPPPTKFARTIHNASDPPQSAASRSGAAPRSRRGSKLSEPRRSIAEGTRAQTKNRKKDKRKDKRSSKASQKERAPTPSTKLGEDVDMKAAATLTSLLLQKRPSMTENASSPRSSISAPLEPGSSHSYSHFAQSSTRTTTASTTAVNSAEPSFVLPNHRSVTPPPHRFFTCPPDNVTPKATGTRPHAPTDNEAADLMLYLATSPSPARPTTSRDKDAKDVVAFRALGDGEGLRDTGRVLFPGAGAGHDSSGTLTNTSENSFAISIGSEIFGGELGVWMAGEIANPVPEDDSGVNQLARMAPQLLPPPPSPSVKHITPDSSSQTLSANSWPSSYSVDHKSVLQAPPTPNTLSFNFNDFINVSPSPIAPLRNANTTNQSKSSLSSSLKADIGRKLFEDEQHNHHQAQTTSFGGDLGSPAISSGKLQGFEEEFEDGTSRRGGSLGAGIDLLDAPPNPPLASHRFTSSCE